MGTLLRDHGFLVALALALAGVAAVWWCATRDLVSLPLPAVVVVASLVGLRVQQPVPFSLLLGVGLLALGAWAGRDAGAGILTAVAVLAGVVFLVVAVPDEWPTWIGVLVFLTALPMTPVVELRARKWARLAPAALFLASAGAYVCVPDTEVLRPLVASLLVATVAAFVPGMAPADLGSGVVAGLLIWSVGIDGIGRPGSVVGGLACVAALALFPAFPTTSRPRPAWWIAAGVTVALVVWCARVAGFVHSAWLAALLAAAGFVVAGLVLGVSRLGRVGR
ncbi:MAG: hypothetical protein U0W40_00495 [Acidimicrobiia bacterium]